MANPALGPLVDSASDILSVLIDPLYVEHGPPRLPRQIVNRINELSFGASWVTEMRQIQLINELCDKNTLVRNGKRYERKRFHVIRADGFMNQVGAASKSTPSIEFFRALRDAGWAAAQTWVRDWFGCTDADVHDHQRQHDHQVHCQHHLGHRRPSVSANMTSRVQTPMFDVGVWIQDIDACIPK